MQNNPKRTPNSKQTCAADIVAEIETCIAVHLLRQRIAAAAAWTSQPSAGHRTSAGEFPPVCRFPFSVN